MACAALFAGLLEAPLGRKAPGSVREMLGPHAALINSLRRLRARKTRPARWRSPVTGIRMDYWAAAVLSRTHGAPCVTFPERCRRSVAFVGEAQPAVRWLPVEGGMSAMRWACRSAWLLWAATLVVAAVGLALMVWDWSTPVPSGSFGVRGFSGLWGGG